MIFAIFLGASLCAIASCALIKPIWEVSPTILLTLSNMGAQPLVIDTIKQSIDLSIKRHVENVVRVTAVAGMDSTDIAAFAEVFVQELKTVWSAAVGCQDDAMLTSVKNYTSHFITAILVLSNQGRYTFDASVIERTRLPQEYLEMTSSTLSRDALLAIEYEMRLTVSLIEVWKNHNGSLLVISDHYTVMHDYTFDAVKKCFGMQSGESKEPFIQAISWAQDLYSKEMAILAASSMTKSGNFSTVRVLPISFESVTFRKPNLNDRISTEILSILMAAQKILPMQVFQRFTINIVAEFILYIKPDRFEARIIEIKRMLTLHKDQCNFENLARLFETFLLLSQKFQSLGVQSYHSAYTHFPCMLEAAKLKGDKERIDLLVNLALDYERVYTSFHALCKVWNVELIAIFEPLSELLKTGLQYNPIPETIRVSTIYNEGFRKQSNWIFGFSPVVKNAINHVMSLISVPSVKTMLLFSIDRVFYINVSLKTNMLMSKEEQVIDHYHDNLHRIIVNDHSSSNVLSLYKHIVDCVLQYSKYERALLKANLQMWIDGMDSKPTVSPQDHFERLCAHANILYSKVKGGTRNHHIMESISRLQQLIRAECKLTLQTCDRPHKIIYTALYTLQVLQQAQRILN